MNYNASIALDQTHRLLSVILLVVWLFLSFVGTLFVVRVCVGNGLEWTYDGIHHTLVLGPVRN